MLKTNFKVMLLRFSTGCLAIFCAALVSCRKTESPIFCLKVRDVSSRADEFRRLASEFANENGLKGLDQSSGRKTGSAGYALSIRAEDSSVAVSFIGGEEEYGFTCIYGAASSSRVNDVSIALGMKLASMNYRFLLDKRLGFNDLQDKTKNFLQKDSAGDG